MQPKLQGRCRQTRKASSCVSSCFFRISRSPSGEPLEQRLVRAFCATSRSRAILSNADMLRQFESFRATLLHSRVVPIRSGSTSSLLTSRGCLDNLFNVVGLEKPRPLLRRQRQSCGKPTGAHSRLASGPTTNDTLCTFSACDFARPTQRLRSSRSSSCRPCFVKFVRTNLHRST